ncbi:MAG TPA: carboxypeptidase-like regulatory domain-containing protein [Bryobacteraceae bacterium]|nr:carboxypeptidase-like regulatory domain-containing protein [Bryobacteraceae bacterium]
MEAQKRSSILRASMCVLATWLILPSAGWSQQVTAAITGQVTDPAGAPIPDAAVIAKDLERGTEWPTQTNSEGYYNLPRLPVGTYEIRVEAKGFQRAVYSPVTLVLNQSARVNFQMKIGEISETVEVTAAPPLLQTDTTQLNTVIDSRTNMALPLATRNYVQLTLLAPGSVNPNPQTLTNGQTTANSGRPFINGNREQSNNFLLDGLDNNQVSDNLVGYAPSVDAIQEFNMITNNAPAEFGNFQGGIISVFIKSGTNEFHGTLFEFFRNDVLNANSWSNNFNGIDKAKLRWNMFGGSIGGPIKKNKVFFFADYQGQRFSNPSSTSSITVFTAAERRGDFSQLLTQRGVQLFNPFNLDASGNRTPFPNNQIPLSLANPVALNLFNNSSLYPLPANNNLQNNQFNTSRSSIDGDQGDVKIDVNFSEKDRFFGRYSQSRQDNPVLNSFPLIFPTFFMAPTHSGVLSWTRVISPTFVNEVRAGVNYVLVNNGGSDNGLGNVADQLGILNGNAGGPGLFALNFGAALVTNIGSANIGTQQLFADTVIQVQDSAIITRGIHIMHAGFQYWRQRINTFYAGNNGRTGFLNFSGKFTAGPAAQAVAGSGSGAGEGDFFLGLPNDLGRGVNTGTWGQRAHVIAAYFQDDIRLTPRLTINIGLRYETHTPWVEVKNRQVNFAPISGAIQFAGQKTIYSNDRALYNSYNTGFDFQPRFGFAWTPARLGGQTVLRGAYTISTYLEGTGTNLRLPLNPPFNQEFENRYDTLTLPLSTLTQGLTVLGTPADPFAGANIRLWDPNVHTAISKQWNFTVQHQFPWDTTVQAGYVGQFGTHLMVPMPYFQRQLLPGGGTAPSPFLSGNPALANITQISGTASNGAMRYDALQAVALKRWSNGLQYQIAYTYSKCMTNSIGYYGASGQAAPASAYWQNLFDKRAQWGPCFFDVNHSLVTYGLIELPFGRGKKFGRNASPAVNALIGNWNLNGIFSWHTGFPLTISGGDASGTNSRGPRANCIAPPNVFGTSNSPAGGYQWFDPSRYAAATPGTFGTCGVGTVRGPKLNTFDLGIQKEFPFMEAARRIQFRAEFLNLTNTPILNTPNTSLGAQLGLLQSSQGARNIQLALKVYF